MIFKTGEQDKYAMIFPRPFSEEYYDEYYTPKKAYDTSDFYGFYLENKAGSEDISLKTDGMLGEEEYRINVGADGAELVYSSEKGLFYALSSLRQLFDLGGGKIRYAKIYDKPQFAHRGYMLDMSRGRKPKPELIYKIIDFMCGLKLNELQLYMEDFCFKYKGFERYTDGFDCLTGEDIVNIDRYCRDRFIELVPNQNGFGHMGTWLAEEEFSDLEVTGGSEKTDTINILDPRAFELVDRIYEGVLPYFSSRRVHIGLDEAMGLGKYQLEAVCREKGKAKVFTDWLGKLSGLCEKKYGKSVMFWADMIINHPESFGDIPADAVPVEWDYEDISMQLVEQRCRALRECGRSYYIAPSTHNIMSHTGRFDEAVFNIRAMAECGQKFGADGFLLTDWGDGGHQHNFAWSYVKIALAAQYAWNVGYKQHGGWKKSYFVRNAQNYTDKYVFGAQVSADMCKLANYYLLEPERQACGSMIAMMMEQPLGEYIKPDFFDIRETGDVFMFENIIEYVKTFLARIEAKTFDKALKDEIRVNAEMVILGAEYMIAKLNGSITREKYEMLDALCERIIEERRRVWLLCNYEKGVELYEDILKARKAELAEFVK